MQGEIKQIGTHNGTFHCDEALACFLLRVLHPKAEIVRTRDLKILNSLPIIVDVGATYEPEKGRFDHHQKGFEHTFDDKHKTKLSSAGLIYKHFGLEVIRKLTNCSDEQCKIIYQKVYDGFIEALDGIDNGINQYACEHKPRYSINTDLSARVGRLNPSWNESGVDIQDRFHEAMALAGAEFTESVMWLAKSWFPARDIVKRSLEKRFAVHSSGEIMKLDQYTVWKRHLLELELEAETKVEKPIKYVLYADENKSWRVQAVGVGEDSFDSRLPLPEAWRGLRDEELSKLSGIPGCVFVHASGFIGGHANEAGALKMATTALELAGSGGSNSKDTQHAKDGVATKKQRVS